MIAQAIFRVLRSKYLALLIAAFLVPNTTYAGSQDPLSLTEQAKAEALVESSLPALKIQAESTNQAKTHELLLIERDRAEDKKSGARRAPHSGVTG